MVRNTFFSSLRSIRLSCLLILFSTALYAERNPGPKTYYVDYRSPLTNIGSPLFTGDGLSWPKALPDLQLALHSAQPGDTIRMAQGTYKPSAMFDLAEADASITFTIPTGVTLEGGYAGMMERDPDLRDIHAYETILCGDLLENDTPFTHPSQRQEAMERKDNAYHVVTMQSPSEYSSSSLTTVMSGLTIRGGNAHNAPLPFGGGMVLDYSSAPSLRNVRLTQCTFMDNFATIGGALYGTSRGSLEIVKCSFIGNGSSLRGGAIYLNENLKTTITTCQLSGNWTHLTGGAISFDNGAMMQTDIEYCSFSENIAETQPLLPDTTEFGQPSGGPNVNASLFWNSNYPLIWEEFIQERNTGRYIDTGFNHVEGYHIDFYFQYPPYVDSAGHDRIFGTLDDNLQIRPDSLFIDRSLPSYYSKSPPLPADPNLDLAGNPRIKGPRIDSGAFEFQYQLYIDDDSTTEEGIGTFDKPYPSIQEALNHAKDDYQVILLPGTYQAAGHNGSTVLNLSKNALHLSSIAPHDPEIIANTIIEGTIRLQGSSDANYYLSGFTLRAGPHGGLFGQKIESTLSHCMIIGNETCDGTVITDWHGLIQNCLIADNRSTNQCGLEPVMKQCLGTLRNCTITGNSSGVHWVNGTIENCIIYSNGETPPFSIIDGRRPGPVYVSYSNIEGGQANLPMTNVVWGSGNLDTPPRFIQAGLWLDNLYSPGDYHLRSRGWQWNQSQAQWDFDPFLTSPCIDAGNPESDLGDELLSVPNDPTNQYGMNHHINMGFYGGTSQASLAPPLE